MGWFQDVMSFAKGVVIREGEDYTLKQLGANHGVAEPSRDLVVGQDYVTIEIRSSRIVNVRQLASTFYGSVQSRAHYLHQDRGEVEYQTVIVPDFHEMDPANVDRILVINKPVLGPVPYLGGLSLELGLFAVKGSDLAAPYLQLLTSLASKSGVAALGVALPYAETLRKGADLLFGNAKQSSLQIGMDQSWKTLSTGTWLLMRAPKGKEIINELRFDPTDGKVTDLHGDPYKDYPYLVFSVHASRRRDDWMMIPELKTAWDAIGKAVRERRTDEAEQLMRQFELVAQWSADLVPDDVTALIQMARVKLPPLIQPTSTISDGEAAFFPGFEELDLYHERSPNA